QEVDARDGHFGLIRPRATEGAARLRQNGPGFAAVAQPGRVTAHDLGYIIRLSIDRELASPGEDRPAILTWLGEGAPISRHLLIAQLPHHVASQELLEERILREHHRLAGRRA